MIGGEGSQRGAAQHVAVVADEFADHRDRATSGQPEQVDRGLGVSCAPPHATLPIAQWEHVSGPARLPGLGGGVGQCTHGCGPVGGRYAGAGLEGVDGDRERGEVVVGVVGDHRGQPEPVGVDALHRHADDAGAVADGEGQLPWGGRVGGEYEVALVLAVRVVGDHDHPAAGERIEGCLQLGVHRRAHRSQSRKASTMSRNSAANGRGP